PQSTLESLSKLAAARVPPAASFMNDSSHGWIRQVPTASHRKRISGSQRQRGLEFHTRDTARPAPTQRMGTMGNMFLKPIATAAKSVSKVKPAIDRTCGSRRRGCRVASATRTNAPASVHPNEGNGVFRAQATG